MLNIRVMQSIFPSLTMISGDSSVCLFLTDRNPRAYRRGNNEDHDYDDHHDDHSMGNDEQKDMKAVSEPKVDYWGGYYDFLINEGSYKFWAVFQVRFSSIFFIVKTNILTKCWQFLVTDSLRMQCPK